MSGPAAGSAEQIVKEAAEFVALRIIGARHRVKKTKKQEARPTQLMILQDGKSRVLELEDDTAELDFVMGRYPTKWREIAPDEDISKFPPHHIKWRKPNEGEEVNPRSPLVRKLSGKGKFEVAHKVPSAYDGLKQGDVVVMILGGSGDRLAYAISRKGQEIGAKEFRLPGFILEKSRNGRDKDEDALTLAELWRDHPDLFYPVEPRDRKLINLRERLRARNDAMKARIACEQRLYDLTKGRIFCNEGGLYPEGGLKIEFDRVRASDTILQNLEAEEKKRDKELEEACKAFDVYCEVFAGIDGMGPMISARLIANIQDIRRFATDTKLKAFCSVHVRRGGKYENVPRDEEFARKRQGQVCNWHPDARQALYLFGDQMNRHPDYKWGAILLEYKRKLRQKHPYPLVVDDKGVSHELIPGKFTKKGNKKYALQQPDGTSLTVSGTMKYGDGHILKMAIWRTLTKFVEWLFKAWWKLEKQLHEPKPEPKPEPVAAASA